MELRFSWHEHNGRFYPVCERLEDQYAGHLLLGILADDGGLGLDRHIPWLGQCIVLCGNVLRGESVSEDFTTEVFAACIEREWTSIHFITSEPDSGETIQTGLFLRIVSDWVKFLERGLHKDCSDVVVHSYSP
ncbi:hypothetical protein [Tahibacter harae]|uniref:Uncharacterized protein n=1 Tax=Tahibacter harae TaxID=2963937 RepID=A0ABT1QTG2_9GAMM|nr:hypothetical protein [Tahibacter harae]MCQ4165572.1 hypothetical protein [Tahibacter harae]